MNIFLKILEEASTTSTGAIIAGALGGTGALIAALIYKSKEIIELIKKLRGKSLKELLSETRQEDMKIIKDVVDKQAEIIKEAIHTNPNSPTSNNDLMTKHLQNHSEDNNKKN